MILNTSFTAWINRFINCARGCFGCCIKPTPITAVDEPSKGLRIQGQTVKKPSASDDFWSTSTYEMDNSTVQSQKSMSSISISNQSLSHSFGTGSTSNHSEFVNHGLLLWNQTRLQWSGNRKTDNHRPFRKPRLSWDGPCENMLGSNERCPQPIPLPEMVEFLADMWEQEGLYQ
ncbi:uncharacterized protein LOC131316034 isoform X1 [Rhododendron vialii]|uniref:uncharacterized protein LOC131316034 isoform X1 n=2 Tax=Rhododendron vialii TaxID=182163 RepID=UPI00265EA840|nr:uncharacterized protein LOC131316034 isoform X1 [Rhododendron vialii]